MIKALRVVMVIDAVKGILFGLAFIFSPDQMADLFNVEMGHDFWKYFAALIGAESIAYAVFLIMAVRDPIRHISWVKFAIVWALFGALVALYSLIRGYGDFGQLGLSIIMPVVFAVLFLVFYPWRVKQSST